MGKVLSVNDDLHAPGCGTAWGMAGVAGNTPGELPPRTAPPLPSHLGSLQSPAPLGSLMSCCLQQPQAAYLHL